MGIGYAGFEVAVTGPMTAVTRGRRRQSHGRLKRWAEDRGDFVSMPGVLGQKGGGARHMGGDALNSVEWAADRFEAALRVERFVRAMLPEWRLVVVGVYLQQWTQMEVARALGIERNRVVARLQDVQDRLAREWDALEAATIGERERKALTSACKSLDFAHAA